MKKTIAILAAIGLLGVVGSTAFGYVPPGKDLTVVITNVVTGPVSWWGDRSVFLQVVVRNKGTLNTPACWLQSRRITNCIYGPGSEIQYVQVPALQRGQSVAITLQHTIPVDRNIYTIRTDVDWYNTVAEFNENNNWDYRLFPD